MKTINTSQHIIIQKKWETWLKSQELVENLNSISEWDIKTIWEEIESWIKEWVDRKEKLKQQDLDELERKEENKNYDKLQNRRLFNYLCKSPEGLNKLHKLLDKMICLKVYDIIKDCSWSEKNFWQILELCLMTNSWILPMDRSSASVIPGRDCTIAFYIHSNNWSEVPGWATYWRFVLSINVVYNSKLDCYEVALPNVKENFDPHNHHSGFSVSFIHSLPYKNYDSDNRSKELLEEKMELIKCTCDDLDLRDFKV